MVEAFTLYLVAVGSLPVAFMAVYAYYELDTAAGRPLRRRGVTQSGIAVTTVVSLGTVLAFGFLGDVNIFDSAVDVRSVGTPTIGFLIPYVLGLLGVNGSYTFARRWRRLHPDNDVPTGSVEPGEVACTGAVVDSHVEPAPVSGREAAGWSWAVEVYDPHGVGEIGQRQTWDTVESGDSDRAFTVDDGSGPVRVDPAEATLDLGAERSVHLDADQPPNFDSPAPDVERTHGDRERRYTETVVAPGDQVAIAGTARLTDEGLTVGGPDAHVAVGTLATVASRYRNRAVLYGVAGLAGTAVGLRWLAGLYGVF